MDVGLVPGVPDEAVTGRIEYPVQCERQFDDPEVAAQVPSVRRRHRLDDELPDLTRQGRQLLQVEPAQVARAVDRLQQHPSKVPRVSRWRYCPWPAALLRILARAKYPGHHDDRN